MNYRRLFGVICLVIAFSTPASAIPTLQLYIEGATYDTASETWVAGFGQPFKLWVIGDLNEGTLKDVKLSAAVAASESGSITLTPTTTILVTDPSAPGAPILTANFPSADRALPQYKADKKGGTEDLPSHGIYGLGTKFYEWNLGNFTLKDSHIGDFGGKFPSTSRDEGQINVYQVTFSGFSKVHFDAYDGDKKAPFSHDAEVKGPVVGPVPVPSSLLLIASGLLGLALAGWRRKA